MYVGGRLDGRPHDIDDATVGALHLVGPGPNAIEFVSDVYRTERRANGSVIHRHLRTLVHGEHLEKLTDSGEGFRWDVPALLRQPA